MQKQTYTSPAIILTIIIHSLILALFLLYKFHTPTPLPTEQGILVNFGDMDQGSGDQEPLYEQADKIAQPEAVKEEDDKESLTQNNEEAPAIDEKKTDKKKKDKKPVDKTVVKTAEDDSKQTEHKVNPMALYRGKGNAASSGEGIAGGSGNQGQPNGVANAKNYVGGGNGNSGISFTLEGREPQSLPKPSYNSQTEGIVVVEITVDKEGKVTKANAGVKGSTTLENSLVEAAERAAMQSSFKRSPNAPAYQKGIIRYHFRLQ
jgi:colicin import membrane protein